MSFQNRMFPLVVCLLAQLLSGQIVCAQNDQTRAYKRYAQGLMKNYDMNENGFLEESEVEKMRRPPQQEADTDQDGKFSVEELLDAVRAMAQPKRKPAGMIAGAAKNTIEQGGLGRLLIGGKVDGPLEGKVRALLGPESAEQSDFKKKAAGEVHLFQFDPSAKLSVVKFLASRLNDDTALQPEERMETIYQQESIAGASAVSFNLAMTEEFEISCGGSEANSMQLSAMLLPESGSDIICRLDVQASSGSAKAVRRVRGGLSLEAMILKKIQEKTGRFNGAGAARIVPATNSVSQFALETTLICKPGDYETVIVNHEGHLWLVVARFDWR